MTPRYKIVAVPHPYKRGDRVWLCGKPGTVRRTTWQGKTAMVTIATDDQGSRRPAAPERRYCVAVDMEVRLMSAVDQLGELVT